MNTQILFIIDSLAIVLLLGTVAYFWWRTHDLRRKNRTGVKLASSLQDERIKSDIILSAISDGVVLVDDKNTIRHFNPGATSITGWSKQDAEGLNWQGVFRFVNTKSEPLADENTPFSKAFRLQKAIHDNSVNLMSKSDKLIAASFSVSPLIDQTGRVTGLVGIFRDVSDERQEQNQRAEFISTASHEMRTPVAAIEGYLSLALNEKVATIDGRARDFLEKAHASTQHLGQLFQDLLTSAKAEDGRLTNHPRVIEMGAYLEQLAQDLRFTAEKKNLFMEFLFGNNEIVDASLGSPNATQAAIRPLYYVVADPDRMREVITNLFDNACKYTDEGKISLGLTGNDAVVQIYIRDTGNGIPAEDIPHLFQKFYRVDSSATRTIGGTGLGLFICRKIVELYQGHIWVESTVDKGSTFYINLPRITTVRAEQLIAKDAAAGLTPLTASSTPTAPVSRTPLATPEPTIAPDQPANNTAFTPANKSITTTEAVT
jgi:PAS domain S-box-containing protein